MLLLSVYWFHIGIEFQVLWDNLKRQTRRKVDYNKMSGSGGEQPLTRVDEAMLDILGRDTVYERGLEMDDDSPVINSSLAVPSNTTQASADSLILSFPGSKENPF